MGREGRGGALLGTAEELDSVELLKAIVDLKLLFEEADCNASRALNSETKG